MDHPCISRAKEQHAKDSASPMWREHWYFRVLQGRKLLFRGSYDACMIATGACDPHKPWRVVSMSGEEQVANR